MANSNADVMPGGLEGDENDSHLKTTVIITSVLNALLIPICIAGNALVLAAVLRAPSLRTPSTILLCNLAVTDLLVGLLVLPVYIANALINSWGITLSRLSQARFVLPFLLCGVSLDTVTAISVDRYLALRYHLRYPNLMTSKRAIYISATFWCINVILLSFLSIWKRDTILLVDFVFVAVCLLISSVTYSTIYRIVRYHQHQIQAQQQAVQSMNNEHNLKIQAKKCAANTFIYYICMILCYFPQDVSILIFLTFKEHWNIKWYFADTAVFMNSAINPFLYCWRNRQIREAVLKIVRKMLCKTDVENIGVGYQ